ncbi:MAG: acyl carrier protein [Sphaerospermopsis sp. SIO1G2]|nr:acyl carrier protein [Sphaerospermopsis sp. SIO1G1]NET73100.1 acyl carrier protein [Sphaerospermopsis sp. SIO1G2]
MDSQKQYTEQKIQQVIKDYILRDIMYEMSDITLVNDLPLIQNRILDSMSMLKLQSFLEEEFNLTINPEEVLPENFETVNNLTSFVMGKLNVV